MTVCFHCGGDVPTGSDFGVEVRGVVRPVCCAGCRAVATLIEQEGLSRFYEFRSAPSVKPDDHGDVAAWSVCDRPEVARQLTHQVDAETNELHCRVDGVTCAACAWLIDRGLRGLEGISDVSVNPISAEAVIRYDPGRVALSRVLATLASFGFAPRVQTRNAAATAGAASRAELKRLAVAGLGAMQVMTLTAALYLGAFKNMDAVYESYFALVSMLIATPVVLYAGTPFFIGAWRSLARRHLGMDVPVALALIAALAVSIANALRAEGPIYFESATMFLFFLTLGRFLEARTRHRAGGVFNALQDLQPLAALRKRGAAFERIGTIELAVGDIVMVAPGEPVPADGELVSPRASFDEALLSGESCGQERCAGDTVLGGSLNAGSEPVEIRVTRLGSDSYVERIGSLLNRALADRPRFLDLADRFAAWFVGGLLIVTACVGAAWFYVAPERAFEIILALLVVTCPCALSLAAPTAFAVALGRLAQRGLLLTSSRVIERLRDVDLWMLDKTGTLTEGRMGVVDVRVYGELDASASLAIAAALEAGIEHPIARALRAAGTAVSTATSLDYRAGFGITGTVEGRRYRLGSARHVGHGATAASGCVYLADEQRLIARIELADRLRPRAKLAIEDLAAQGEVALVSGDAPLAVEGMAMRLGIHRYFAAQAPADKLELLREAQRGGRVVAAVGDGINDAPWLAQADVSIAMVAGSRLAQAAADVVFTGEDLRVLASLPAAAATTRRIVRENLVWAALYNLVAVPLAAMGFLAPWMAAIGMSLSSLIVVGNALRLNLTLAPRVEQARIDSAAAPLPGAEAA